MVVELAETGVLEAAAVDAHSAIERILDEIVSEATAAGRPLPRLPLFRLKGKPKPAADVLVRGERAGTLVVFAGAYGLRYAVPFASVLALRDGDESQSSTLMQVVGGREMLIEAPLDEVLRWFG
jgi:hypothetical protein